jgi:hypothetical protein
MTILITATEIDMRYALSGLTVYTHASGRALAVLPDGKRRLTMVVSGGGRETRRVRAKLDAKQVTWRGKVGFEVQSGLEFRPHATSPMKREGCQFRWMSSCCRLPRSVPPVRHLGILHRYSRLQCLTLPLTLVASQS